MDPRIAPLVGILEVNTRLFRNCLADLTEAQSRQRPTEATNHAAFVAAHLVESRYYILKGLGAPLPCPLASYLGEWRGIDQISEWPTLAEVRNAWEAGSQALMERLGTISAAELDAPSPTKMPVYEQTALGVLAFLIQHDSYHIGQLSLLRKYAGLPAMSYS